MRSLFPKQTQYLRFIPGAITEHQLQDLFPHVHTSGGFHRSYPPDFSAPILSLHPTIQNQKAVPMKTLDKQTNKTDHKTKKQNTHLSKTNTELST